MKTNKYKEEFMFKGTIENKPAVRADQVNGLLDKGTSFEGKLTFDGTVQINGSFNGEVYSDGTLIVGNDAHVEGGIFVDTLIVYGTIQGSVTAKSRIEMHVPAQVIADVKTKTLSVEEGVVFQGNCQMERQNADRSHLDIHNDDHVNDSTESEGDNNVFVM